MIPRFHAFSSFFQLQNRMIIGICHLKCCWNGITVDLSQNIHKTNLHTRMCKHFVPNTTKAIHASNHTLFVSGIRFQRYLIILLQFLLSWFCGLIKKIFVLIILQLIQKFHLYLYYILNIMLGRRNFQIFMRQDINILLKI